MHNIRTWCPRLRWEKNSNSSVIIIFSFNLRTNKKLYRQHFDWQAQHKSSFKSSLDTGGIVCLYLYACVCISVYICVCVYVCMYICMDVCTREMPLSMTYCKNALQVTAMQTWNLPRAHDAYFLHWPFSWTQNIVQPTHVILLIEIFGPKTP